MESWEKNIRIDTFVPWQSGLDRSTGTEVAKRLRNWTKRMKKLKKKEQLGYNISYPSSPAAVGVRAAALRSISLSCRTGNRPQSAPACSFLRYRSVYRSLKHLWFWQIYKIDFLSGLREFQVLTEPSGLIFFRILVFKFSLLTGFLFRWETVSAKTFIFNLTQTATGNVLADKIF